ncbi:MAG TPA: TetR/AcrR family transcriptional regulator [Povalibacter sp.]|uniref:TetR/AcrR family transcriptional regulator n=1 Tax=Povalibacter sp. TaxID=1962978 RepID=UPI002C92418A|nr:TetR/AcrR family transcriptional regulator [Povalibacter sp.]HMN44316.1 TetR/AcrR family transcriptional regulator [Povalibacter sp.]
MGRPAAAKPGEEAPESVRDRILNTARELFYREGARAVGVDMVVAQSGVAKTSLYRWFPSKDALIAAVLEQEAQDRWTGWDRNIERAGPTPREKLRAQFQGIARFVSSPKYRGCPFRNITVEFPDSEHPARKIASGVQFELQRRIRGLVDQMEGVRDPAELTDQLVLLVDGAFSVAQCMGSDGPQKYVVAAADVLIDNHLRPAG